MSGLAFVLHLDGRPAEAADLSAMLAEMTRRGPDGEDIALTGAAGLGHRHLPTTPEALVEPMPLADSGTGCVLTGDIRLDNRDTLLAAFGLTEPGRSVGDGALVLHAWERWGEDCASHLLGDFAFALWDPRRNVAFAARDQMGMRQLIYAHREGRVFACASSARAVAVQPRVRPGFNDQRIAEALIEYEQISLTSTFFDGVYRLAPGHCLTVSDTGLTLRAYWQMTPPAPLRLNSDADYADAFKELLTEAVRARTRSAGPIGSMLSGGLDSGSVVALASRMTTEPLRTFSGVGPDPATCPETRAIHTGLTIPNLAPTLISYDDLSDWTEDLIAAWYALEEPWDFHMTLPRVAYLGAQRAGVRVLLDGVAGDTLLDEGNQMVGHMRSGQFLRAYRDAKGMARYFGVGRDDVVMQLTTAARRAFVPEFVQRLRAKRREHVLPALPDSPVLDPDFAERVGLRQALKEWQKGHVRGRMSFAEDRIATFPRSGITVGRERYDRVAAHYGIETRDPFMDQRLWEFCLRLPADQFQADGLPKILLRRAMKGLLPDDLRLRSGKEHLGWTFTQKLFDQWPDWREPINKARPYLAGKMSAKAFDETTWGGKPLRDDQTALDTLIQLSLFVLNQRFGSGGHKIDKE